MVPSTGDGASLTHVEAGKIGSCFQTTQFNIHLRLSIDFPEKKKDTAQVPFGYSQESFMLDSCLAGWCCQYLEDRVRALFPAGSVRIEVLDPGRWGLRAMWNVSSGLEPPKLPS